jgi:hypothetical protein
MTLSSRVSRSGARDDRLDTVANLIAVLRPLKPRTHIGTTACAMITKPVTIRDARSAADARD